MKKRVNKSVVLKRLKSLAYDLEDLRKVNHNIVNQVYFNWATKRDLPKILRINKDYDNLKSKNSLLNFFLVERFSNILLTYSLKFSLNAELANNLENFSMKNDSLILRKGLFFYLKFNTINAKNINLFVEKYKNLGLQDVFHEDGNFLYKQVKVMNIMCNFRLFSRTISNKEIFSKGIFLNSDFFYSLNLMSYVVIYLFNFYYLLNNTINLLILDLIYILENKASII